MRSSVGDSEDIVDDDSKHILLQSRRVTGMLSP
jgi:hypothetical protein